MSTLAFVLMQLDNICIRVVQWMPYKEQKVLRHFKWIALFSRYIRLRACKQMHFPECVLRQFAYIQCIVTQPPFIMAISPYQRSNDEG